MATSTTNINVRADCDHDGIPFEVKRYTPNAATRVALNEYEEMKKDPDAYKRYDSFDELTKEVL